MAQVLFIINMLFYIKDIIFYQTNKVFIQTNLVFIQTNNLILNELKNSCALARMNFFRGTRLGKIKKLIFQAR